MDHKGGYGVGFTKLNRRLGRRWLNVGRRWMILSVLASAASSKMPYYENLYVKFHLNFNSLESTNNRHRWLSLSSNKPHSLSFFKSYNANSPPVHQKSHVDSIQSKFHPLPNIPRFPDCTIYASRLFWSTLASCDANYIVRKQGLQRPRKSATQLRKFSAVMNIAAHSVPLLPRRIGMPIPITIPKWLRW